VHALFLRLQPDELSHVRVTESLAVLGTLIHVQTIGKARARVTTAPARTQPSRLTGGGTIGNERLTSLTGAALLIPLAVIGITLLHLRGLMNVHLFVGLLLIGPVLLKLASTGYRFVRYYTHNAAYRLRGAPPLAQRALGPGIVITTVLVLASGVALLFVGPGSRGILGELHKVAFIAWAAFFAVHVLAHLLHVGDALRAETAPPLRTPAIPGRDGRLLALVGSLAAGAVLAVLLVPEFAVWVQWSAHHHHH
jgi:hypothetical protein